MQLEITSFSLRPNAVISAQEQGPAKAPWLSSMHETLGLGEVLIRFRRLLSSQSCIIEQIDEDKISYSSNIPV